MALGNLITINNPTIFNQIPNIVILWIGTLADLTEDHTSSVDSNHIQNEVEDWLEESGSAEALRRLALHQQDPLQNFNLAEFLNQKLQQAQNLYGNRLEGILNSQVEHVLLEEFMARLHGVDLRRNLQ